MDELAVGKVARMDSKPASKNGSFVRADRIPRHQVMPNNVETQVAAFHKATAGSSKDKTQGGRVFVTSL